MYFWRFGRSNTTKDNTISDIVDSTDISETVIDIREEDYLLGETEEVISYDDLNISNDNKIVEMSNNISDYASASKSKHEPEHVPRPTLVIPKSPIYQQRISDSSSDSDSENKPNNDSIENNSIEIYQAENSVTPTKIDEILASTSVTNEDVETNRKYSLYATNTILCGIFVYVVLEISGVV